jgi:hypothetical protein
VSGQKSEEEKLEGSHTKYITLSLSEVYSVVKKVSPFITQNVVLSPT